MKHEQWFSETTNGDSLRKVESASGVPYRTVQNQMKAGRFSAENVIAIATAYGHHPVGALVETGYLDEKWATQVDPIHALRTVTEDQLADEVLRRMKLGQANGALDEPIDQLEEKRRSKKSNTTTPAVRPQQQNTGIPADAVADSSPETGGTLDDLDP